MKDVHIVNAFNFCVINFFFIYAKQEKLHKLRNCSLDIKNQQNTYPVQLLIVLTKINSGYEFFIFELSSRPVQSDL